MFNRWSQDLVNLRYGGQDRWRKGQGMNERRFSGSGEHLRAADRDQRVEIDRVVSLSLDGLTARSMLDVGTGTGYFAEAFSREGLNAAGLDIRLDLLGRAREHLPAAPLVAGRAEALPFAPGAFDLVFMGIVFHEVEDFVGTLAGARRVARRRVVVLEFPCEAQDFGPPLDHRLSPDQVKSFAAEAGFAMVDTNRLTNLLLYRMDV